MTDQLGGAMAAISEAVPRMSTPQRVAAAAVWIVLVLTTAAFVGEHAQQLYDLSGAARGLLQAVIMSGLVVPGIWWLRARVERREVASVGLAPTARNFKALLLGFGFVAVPVLLVIITSRLFGWATISVDTSSAGLSALAIGLITVFLFEALPEELVVRGYIYRNLSAEHARWKASVMSVLLFLTMPILGVFFQHYVLGMEIRINGADSIQLSYLIIMLIFGSFLQYVRVLSGTIWIGIGFHASFVLINRIMGPRESQMIRFVDATNEGAVQLVALGALVLILVTLFAWPWIARRSLGWREVEPE
jgi:membrane protease YdiL (CAAX protease family)